MLQPNHRGIYEYLWSEHKYVALSVSIRTFQTTAGKLGKVPQCLTLLRRLYKHAVAEKPGFLSGLLSAYMHIQPELSRISRERLVKQLLEDEAAGSQLIYDHVIDLNESCLYGNRLFFRGSFAVYKFLDAQDHPGLWILFGPFQLHLTFRQVYARIISQSGLGEHEVQDYLGKLSNSVPVAEFFQWPERLIKSLRLNNLVAEPGLKAHLHPRACFQFNYDSCTINDDFDMQTVAALAIEEIWDNLTITNNQIIPVLPDFADFESAFLKITENMSQHFNAEEAYEYICNEFDRQKMIEQGKLSQV